MNQVRDFLAVAETGSISAAARALRVSQPGLTKSIAALEEELKAPLLQRSPRGIRLTPYGRAFHARAHAAHSELEKAREEIRQLAGEQGGRLSVGFGPVAAALVLPGAMASFHAQLPDVKVRLIEGFAHALLPLVREQILDMAVAPRLPGRAQEPGLVFRPVFHNEQVIVARRGHPLSGARHAAELAGAHWVSFEPREVFERVLTAIGVPSVANVTQCESLNVLLQLVASSDMLSNVSRRLLALPAARGTLQPLALAERIPAVTTGLYLPSGSRPTPAAAVMVRLLVEHGRKLPARAGAS